MPGNRLDGTGPTIVTRLASRIAAYGGWRRRGCAVFCGALAAAALPPVSALPLLFPAFVGFLWLIDGDDRRTAFGTGWWFGFGHFAVALHWIAFALLVDAEQFAWMIPFAVFGLAAGFAIYPGLVALATVASGRRGVGRVLILAAAWTAAEWLRGWLFTGFPWNLIGLTWDFSEAMIQIAAVTGVWGLSLLAVAVAAMPALFGDGRSGSRRPGLAIIVTAAVVFAVWGGGAARLAAATDAVVPDVRLRLVQPNIPQALKWQPELRLSHLRQQVALSRRAGTEGWTPTHVIWAETAATFVVEKDGPGRAVLAAAAPPGGAVVTGGLRIAVAGEVRKVWNSLLAVDDEARVVATYDKFHLVPFGEYVPFREVLPIDKITPGRSDFSAGVGIRTLRIPGLPPVSPLICYEVIFPGQVVDTADRPAWLLNITNDAWFGHSVGPHQHFAAARLRAVEEGLPLVRVANTGISAIIDAHGRVRSRLALGRSGVVDGPLPVAAMAATPYARWGNWIAISLVFAAAVAGFIWRSDGGGA